MDESKILAGLKQIAKFANISVDTLKRHIKKGLKVWRDESGMFYSTTDHVNKYFYDKVEANGTKKKK